MAYDGALRSDSPNHLSGSGVPEPARLHKLGNLLHLSHLRQSGFVTALSLEGAVTRPVARSFNPARLSKSCAGEIALLLR
jgi:hypothetical protein